ncbi:sugar nucleotide-binding protein [Nonomuraea sp. NPDC052634]|uniref:sugar nucleotide-binding protein n=1 Tax=Nonomuraea sp. NPDC052634 TaxID=3155813 RepID=UPI00341D7114
MRVLIVGGSGLLGGELVRLCAAQGHTVAATRFSSPPGPGTPRTNGPAQDVRPGSDGPGPEPVTADGRPVTGGPSPAPGAAATGGPAPGERLGPDLRTRPSPTTVAGGPSPAPGAASGCGTCEWFRLDVRSRAAVPAVIGGFRPDVTINVAYRSGDWATTADGAANVAAAVAASGGRLVHVSSDAVFSGDAPSYDETCLPDPVNPYGAAKAAAETAVRALVPGAAIVRTSLIVGHGASAHEAFVRSLATGSATGVLFTDDVRCPVHVSDLAAALLEIAERGLPGVHHAAGDQALSRYELGLLIARRDGLDEKRLRPGLRAAGGVRGPLEVRLDCSATRRRLHTRLRPASEFLAPGHS